MADKKLAKRRGLVSLLAHPGAVVRFFTDKKAPIWPKLLLVFATLYLISPIDAIPDIAPIVGWLDDAGLLGVAFTWLIAAVMKYEGRKEEEPPYIEAA
jgi:uncharacterized membrane protein YkvA (DUF1232 family)